MQRKGWFKETEGKMGRPCQWIGIKKRGSIMMVDAGKLIEMKNTPRKPSERYLNLKFKQGQSWK